MIIPYLYTLFTALLILYSKFQFKEVDQSNRNFGWKKYGFAMRVSVIILMYIAGGFKYTQDYLLSGAINILVFDIGINIIALGTKPFYNGTTGEIDKGLGKNKWYVWFGLLIITIILKILL